MKLIYALIVTMGILMVGCEDKGPMEKAGEAVDEAATDAGNAIEDTCEEAKKKAGAEDTDC